MSEQAKVAADDIWRGILIKCLTVHQVEYRIQSAIDAAIAELRAEVQGLQEYNDRLQRWLRESDERYKALMANDEGIKRLLVEIETLKAMRDADNSK